MLRAGRGDLAAFETLVEKYQRPLLNFFTRMGVYTDAEDLVQETMIKIFKARKRYRPKARFNTYLFGVARNVWIDRGRREQRRKAGMERLEDDRTARAPGPGGKTGLRMDIQEALDRLPEKLRLVTVMRTYQALSYEEIGRALNIPTGTAKSRMNLAVRKLGDWLNE